LELTTPAPSEPDGTGGTDEATRLAEHRRQLDEWDHRLAELNPRHRRAGMWTLLDAMELQIANFEKSCEQEFADANPRLDVRDCDASYLVVLDIARDFLNTAVNFEYTPDSLGWNPPTIPELRSPRDDLGDEATEGFPYAPHTLVLLIREAVASIPDAHGRLKDLLEHATFKKVDGVSSYHLRRLTRLYLWGYEDEMRVMARAVLEGALMNLAVHAGIIRRDVDGLADDPKLDDLIRMIGWNGRRLLNQRQTFIATKIRLDGNAVVHKKIEHVRHYTDGAILLKDLSEVLNESLPEHPFSTGEAGK
jgi:hypothetical protein